MITKGWKMNFLKEKWFESRMVHMYFKLRA